MKEYMTVYFKKGEIGYKEKQERIFFGELDGILDANYIVTGEIVKVYYSISNFSSMKNLNSIGAIEAVNLLGGVMECIFDLSDHLIWPEEYIINENIVFISDTGEIKFAYIPDKNRIDLKIKVKEIYEKIFEKTNLTGKEYLEIIMREMESNKVNSKEKIIKLVNSIKEEINVYGINKNG